MEEFSNEDRNSSRQHQKNSPKLIRIDNREEWHIRGKLHRTDGPARIWADGDQSWFVNGKRHRTDGPAIIHADGRQEWYINGHQVDQLTIMLLTHANHQQQLVME